MHIDRRKEYTFIHDIINTFYISVDGRNNIGKIIKGSELLKKRTFMYSDDISLIRVSVMMSSMIENIKQYLKYIFPDFVVTVNLKHYAGYISDKLQLNYENVNNVEFREVPITKKELLSLIKIKTLGIYDLTLFDCYDLKQRPKIKNMLKRIGFESMSIMFDLDTTKKYIGDFYVIDRMVKMLDN